MERRRSKGADAHWRLVIAAVTAGAIVAAPLVYFGQPGRARAASFLTIILVGAVGLRWELRCRPWFWPLIALIALAESPLVIFVSWTSKWAPVAAILPFAIVDLVVIHLLIDRVRKWIDPPQCRT